MEDQERSLKTMFQIFLSASVVSGFEGSNSAKVDGFFQDVKILNKSPLGGTL